ncbi:outer membrane beta-barrel protein [Candidatus Nitronereus thalassa]|uniref:Outer membrane beta-barrel protein n=1 Tax=Candidatus Nitronereus thalassa TaxID=3020898 RepID=A0ABU3KB78_9BACT|nr:outer membrane beta-barrel protein [Candidatus Nitronereus thalassa]MDT7043669.1 outer membrane beta-barrel protein [Candidatus Nitronereus thalassa]
MRTFTIKTLLVFGTILSSIVPSLTHADHLTTRSGEERKIFHGKYDPGLYQPTRIETGWGASLRAGGAFYHGDVIAAVSPDPAILVNGQFFYHINRDWHMGLSVEWEEHNATVGGVDFGTARTISLLPYIEFHFPVGRWSPYASLGVGLNLNDFDEDNQVAANCAALGFGPCDVSPDNTFAFRGGAGVDFFVADNLAINAEAAWKSNSGDGEITVGGTPVLQGDFDASAVQVLVGLRWFFE